MASSADGRDTSEKLSGQKILLFCQAPADIPYILTLYEFYERQSSISIFVINVEGMFKFLYDLQLDLEQLVFIPYQLVNLKRIDLLYSERKRIKLLWKEHFSNIHNGKVYFFSRFEDWLTAAFIHRLARNGENIITYAGHNDYVALLFPVQDKVSLKLKIYLFILKYLTNVSFSARRRDRLPEFQIDRYAILKTKLEVDKQVFVKYAYSIDILDKNASNLLFLISSGEPTVYAPLYYIDTIKSVISLFQIMGFKIFVKGHPRTGLPETVRNMTEFEIPSYVPGEFIDACNFKICLGIDTTALCYFSINKILPTYSVIKLFSYVDNSFSDIFIKYLKQQSDNEMLFINNFEELKKIVLKYI